MSTRRVPRRLNHSPKALRWARKQAGKSQAWLAEQMNVSRSLVVEYEGGTRSADDDRLEQIADLLGCPVEALQARQEAVAS